MMEITFTQISARSDWNCYSKFSPDPAEHLSMFLSLRFRTMGGVIFFLVLQVPWTLDSEKILEKDLPPGETVFLLFLSHLVYWCK